MRDLFLDIDQFPQVQVANTGLDLDTSKVHDFRCHVSNLTLLKTRCAALCQNIADQAIEHQKKCTEGTASREVLKVELDATKVRSERHI